MTNTPPSLEKLRPNPQWAKLPLFDRKGWKTMPFGAFADSINERVEPADAAEEIYVGLDDLDSGNLHIRRWGKGSDVIGTKLRFCQGDIIFGRRRAYQRKLAVAATGGICSAHAMVARAKPELVLPEFLPFRDPTDPLQFVIVTSKLLTGFDAPILQVMYLDKPMKDHNLLQAICRTNRTFGQEKTHGLIVDYIGIFDDVARALNFDEKAVQLVVSNIEELRKALPLQMQKCLAFFPRVDRKVGGYEGLMAAQQCLPNNDTRDKFAAQYSVLGTIWEALSPDPRLSPYETDYRWLTQVYESVKPPSGNGKLLWHALGAKTVDLINRNVHVESLRDDVETLVMDAQVLEDILKDADPVKKGREIEIQLIARLRKHLGNAKFVALGERLEKIKERHEQGFLTNLQFLKEILELAKEVVQAEKQTDPVEERDKAKEALTDLFKEAKNTNTHIIVERIVADIDDIVKKVRFPDWQHTTQGERLVQKELRRTLLKYKLHTDQELFDKAYAYIRQYY